MESGEQGQYGQYAPIWGPPQNGQGEPVTAQEPRARVGLIVLTALLLEFLLVAAGANQWVAHKIAQRNDSVNVRLFENSWLTYGWRFTPRSGHSHQWAGQLLLVLVVFVLTAALVVALCRGPIGWGRAFFGTWAAVLFATVVGAIVRGLVDPPAAAGLRGANRAVRGLFGPSGPSAAAVIGGLGLGLVVALVTSAIAVATRRRAVEATPDGRPAHPQAFADYAPPPPSYPSAPPPWQDQPSPRAWPEPGREGPPPNEPWRDQPTTQLPPAEPAPPRRAPGQEQQPEQEQAPEQTPPQEPAPPQVPRQQPPQPPSPQPSPQQESPQPPSPQQPSPQPPSPQQPAPHGEPTARFPRPPDDEELGHLDH
jgi:hypothetical protein